MHWTPESNRLSGSRLATQRSHVDNARAAKCDYHYTPTAISHAYQERSVCAVVKY